MTEKERKEKTPHHLGSFSEHKIVLLHFKDS